MNGRSPDSRNPPSAKSDASSEKADPAVMAQAKEILALLAHTFSTMRLFPEHHSTVINFQNDLFRKIELFLSTHGPLHIDVHENSFKVIGETVFSDENVLRSLPYLFFKDGLRTFSFFPDLTREELVSFLETVKEISGLPPDEGDIVDALWNKEFAHIQYFAPDDYLISKMAGQHEHVIKVDRERLGTGRLDLDPQDTADIYKSLRVLRYTGPKEDIEFQAESDVMSEAEAGHVQSLLADQRGAAARVDYLDMIVELVRLEDRPARFDGLLDYVERLHDEWLKAGNFAPLAGLIRRLRELVEFLKPISPPRAEAAESFLEKLNTHAPLDAIHDLARQGKVKDFAALFEYLTWLGPRTLVIGSDVVEGEGLPSVKEMAFRFLVDVGKLEPALLSNLAQDRRPATTRAAITVLGETNDRRFIPFLATFLTSMNKEIKLEAVRALGKITDPLAHKTLLGFLRDDYEADIRTEAAKRIRVDLDPGLLQAVIDIAAGKGFIKRGLEERAAVLESLGRNGRDAGYALIGRLLERKSLLRRKRDRAVAISAVNALESLAGPEAVELLRRASETGHKEVKAASRKALDRLEGTAGSPERMPS